MKDEMVTEIIIVFTDYKNTFLKVGVWIFIGYSFQTVCKIGLKRRIRSFIRGKRNFSVLCRVFGDAP